MKNKVENSPWLSILVEPRKTIREIVQTDPKDSFLLLSFIYGLPIAFNFSQNLSLASVTPFWAILIGSLIACVFLGVIGISVSAWLLQMTGQWVGGKGNFQNLRAAVAWSSVPGVVTILMWLILMGVFGGQIFDKQFSQVQLVGYQAGVVFLVFLVQSIASIWAFILLLKTVGEVQGFSAWRALLNVAIPFVMVVVAIWLVGWIFFRG
jgi:hypothetical protein